MTREPLKSFFLFITSTLFVKFSICTFERLFLTGETRDSFILGFIAFPGLPALNLEKKKTNSKNYSYEWVSYRVFRSYWRLRYFRKYVTIDWPIYTYVCINGNECEMKKEHASDRDSEFTLELIAAVWILWDADVFVEECRSNNWPFLLDVLHTRSDMKYRCNICLYVVVAVLAEAAAAAVPERRRRTCLIKYRAICHGWVLWRVCAAAFLLRNCQR